ncbi:3078_t:CDS:2 [Cetraspora pellucida]|uniref:3078_t:CDS:1 n=1 Tax=Cetraspora pellucida TaxID=1433469 RepID=A0A9N9G156_9GLOM|nr:3078_t:CDS:2 [Cetraspora pellucida]
MTTTATYTQTHTRATPRLILRTTNDNNTTASTALVTASTSRSSSPIKTTSSSSLTLPRHTRKPRLIRKHLRKPPSFDTYLSSSQPGPVIQPNTPPHTPPRYPKRSNSLSSSCSSISSEDNPNYPSFSREELIYAKNTLNLSTSSLNSIPQIRTRRSSGATKSVRFVSAEDDKSDRSSIATVSS